MAVAIHRPFYNMPTAAAGIGTQVVTDSFTRANEIPFTGNGWTPDPGSLNFDLTSNAIVPHQTSNDTTAIYSSWASGNDQYSQAAMTVVGTGAETGPGVCVRSDNTTRYRAVINASGTISIAIYNPSYSLLTTRSVTYAATKKLGLAISGTSITV